MKFTFTEQTLNRLQQIYHEIRNASVLDYQDRLQAFRDYCNNTQILSHILAQLPEASFDVFNDEWEKPEKNVWPKGEASYAARWNAIQQMVADPRGAEKASQKLIIGKHAETNSQARTLITQLFVTPVYDYLVHQVEASSTMLYVLLRYKRWAEWFETERLREVYDEDGEDGLDLDLRRFLFESGIDYPFSQPASPGGKVDIVAGLETDDPLVLEVKIWDSIKGYRENRVRDGLRQVRDYADKYGKDRGYVVVFNLDTEPLEFVAPMDTDEWPARIQHGGRTYFFIAVDIAEQQDPISQKDKGKPVKTNSVKLDDLLEKTLNE